MLRITRKGRPTAIEAVDPDVTTGSSRRSFLRATGGLGAGAAAVALPAAFGTASAGATAARPANGVAAPSPTTPQPAAPLMAYVHDARAGTVVIMTGDTQRTVKDRELVRRLTTVSKKKKPKKRAKRRPRRPTTSRKG
jgi:hypothetical protein